MQLSFKSTLFAGLFLLIFNSSALAADDSLSNTNNNNTATTTDTLTTTTQTPATTTDTVTTTTPATTTDVVTTTETPVTTDVVTHTTADTTVKSEMIFLPTKLVWVDGPASLPKGAKMTILEGDPTKEGPFTIRLLIPANYQIAPHTHPGVEHVTVIAGTLYLGMGNKMDMNKATAMPVGSFALMQPGTEHYAFTKGEAIIQLHGMGPWGISFLNS